MGRRGHTTPVDIAKVERLAFIVARRMEGRTFREISLMMQPTISAQAVCKQYWLVIKANPPNRRRHRARLERALLTA